MTRRPHWAINQSGVSVLYHLEKRIEAMEKAVDVAKEELSRRLDGMNHFQSQMREQADTFVRKDLYDTGHKFLIDRVENLRETQLTKADSIFAVEIKRTIDGHIQNQEGKETANSKFIWIVSIIGPMLGAITMWLLVHK